MPTETPTKSAAAEKTKYHVLRQTRKARESTAAESGGISGASPYAVFELVAEDVAANSDQHAIRLHVEEQTAKTAGGPGEADPASVFIAVPSRSWRPTPVEVKVERRVLLG